MARQLTNCVFCLLVFVFSEAPGQIIVVPNSLASLEGDSGAYYPFRYAYAPATIRFQQVFSASQFNAITNAGWIYQLHFRPDSAFAQQNFTGFNATFTNVEIRLSTTQINPDTLTSTFASNVGSDETVVFSNSLAISGGFWPGTSPQAWDISVLLSSDFRYSPVNGNLLMDVLIANGHGESVIVPGFDATFDGTNSVASVYAADSVYSPTGSVSAVGLVTQFYVARNPELQSFTSTLGTETNFVVIKWPATPNGFLLQESDSFGSNAAWETLTNAGGTDLAFRQYIIPTSLLSSNRFFRLIYDH